MPKISATGVRSDMLGDVRQLFESVPMLKMFEAIAQVALIIDGNILIGDILWMSKKKKQQHARTELFELLKAGTIRAFAPTFLLEEMDINIPREARRKGLDIDSLSQIWLEYKVFISFIDVGGADTNYRDPKDAPYIKLQKEIGALIYSRDKHIRQMNGLVVDAAVVASLRIYSRQVVIEYVLKAGGTGCLCVSYGLLKLMSKFIHAMFVEAKRIPKKFLMTAFVILLGMLLYPPSRRYLINSINSLGGRAKSLGVELLKQFGDLVIEHEIAKTNASAALVSANNGIDAALK